MDKYTKAILTILKDKYTEINGEKLFQMKDGAREFYLENLEDNLYRPMDANAMKAYGEGTGNEIASGKMNALRSSSALTYNLFWDQIAEVKVGADNTIGSGVYKVEFEKQYHTLKPSVSRFPANLDAFLYPNLRKFFCTPFIHHFYTKFFNTMQKSVKYTPEI